MDLLPPFLTSDFMGKPAWVWLAFVGIVIALALVLVFTASHLPAVISLSVTFGLIAGGVLVSLWKTRGQSPAGVPA